ncbi:MAG: hypothetical protein AABX13_01150 [Nanoarchaeota archaeon]
MDNFLLMSKNEELERFSQQLGFSRTLFLDKDFTIITSNSAKEALKLIQQGKSKKLLTIYRPPSEELLRYVLEKTPADLVLGTEHINPHDHLHYPRAGLDQVLCKIAAERGKVVAFSCSEILNAVNQPQLLRRMMFNLTLCQKYKVKMLFSTFARDKWEMRSAHDLLALWRVLGGKGKHDLML